MAAAGREPARFVCVTRFGSHQCGCVLQRGGRGVRGRGSLGLGCSPERPRGAAAGAAGGGALRPVPEPGVPAGPSAAPASSARSGPGRAARAGVTQKTFAKIFDFPIPLNEASKIMKKKKKVSVWNRVHKVISRMLEENEKYRLRLKCQQLSSERRDHTQFGGIWKVIEKD
ncbi:uncharacterized protein C5orf47 homolog [Rousettus aegyptiacus]|uniref:uncharacterized protein C5orf47 homolog n=1 Tax=Rousettus aegyptiacus TaxID=9407 RepID=UPI00168D2878|nr:uncharacterized protein C5orf47 homolog [Rousettus aegyptiacus]